MLIARIINKILCHRLHWQEGLLKLKAQRKKKVIYSKLKKEKMKKLATLFQSNRVIK